LHRFVVVPLILLLLFAAAVLLLIEVGETTIAMFGSRDDSTTPERPTFEERRDDVSEIHYIYMCMHRRR